MTPEQGLTIAAAIKVALEGDGSVTEIRAPTGDRLRVERPPVVGLRCEVMISGKAGDYATVRVWNAGRVQPVDYPVDVPFLPDLTTVVTASLARGDGISVSWYGASDTEAAFGALVRETLAAGWVRVGQETLHPNIPVQIAEFRRDGLQRMLTLAPIGPAGVLSLVDPSGSADLHRL